MEINESSVQAMSCQGPRGVRQSAYRTAEHSALSKSAGSPGQPCAEIPSVPVRTAGASQSPQTSDAPQLQQTAGASQSPQTSDISLQTQTAGAPQMYQAAGASHPTQVSGTSHLSQAACISPSQTDCASPSPSQTTAIAYQAAMPYPPVRAAGKNPRYAAAMLDNLGGRNSEMSAVALYFYDHLITSDYKEVSDTFHHISIVEMHHLEIFGTLAMQLGENPRLWSRRGRGGCLYWTPGYLHYPPYPVHGPVPAPIPSIVQPGSADGSCAPPCPPNQKSSGASLRALIHMAVQAEQSALSKYLEQASWIQDPNICDNLRRIAADEQMHVDILTRLYHKY